MDSNHRLNRIICMGLLASCMPVFAQTNSLVYEDGSGNLVYGTYANEGQTNAVNTVPDWSSIGYKGGGVSIPFVQAVETVTAPTGGDDTTLIQEAIDTVAAMPIGTNGFRGAVLIKAGDYQVASTLNIGASGVVIRGEGQGTSGTVITMTATVQDNLFHVQGSGYYPSTGSQVSLTDSFVPSGAKSFTVSSATGYTVGDNIRIHYKMNQAWIDAIGMENIIDPVEGDESWTPAEFQLKYDRVVTAITGNTITIDAPLVQPIEDQYGGADVFNLGTGSSGLIENVGLEALRLESTYLSDTDEAHGWTAIWMGDVKDAWVRQVTARYFGMGCVKVSTRASNVTVEDSAMLDPKSLTTGGRKYSFYIDDSWKVLTQRCYTRGGRHDYVSGSLTPGPNAFVDSLSENAHDDTGPHFRYATGELYDNIKSDMIYVHNRWDWGTGHGWAGAQVMFWNSVATKVACVTPVAAMNWAIGCIGSKERGRITSEPYGIWESHYTHVSPRSLYYRQLQARSGEEALRNVILPQQTAGPIWPALSGWAGEGLFGDPLVVWSDTLVRPLSNTASLKGVVRDLTVLDNGATSLWSKVSGPGTITFADATALETSAAFDTEGEYVLQLLVDDGITPLSTNITITALTADNQPPEAHSQSITLDADTGRSITLSGFDWDDDPLTFTVQASPTNGTLSGAAPDVLYTPDAGYSGPDQFTFTVNDGTYDSVPATVDVQVVGIDPNLLAHWKFDELSGLTADDASAADGALDEHDGTLSNMAGSEWDGAGALAFDGINDYVVATGFKGVTGSNPRTVTAWIKTTADGAIVGWGTDSTSQKYYFRIDGGQLRIEVNGGFLKSTSLVNDGEWHHVALVFPESATDVTDHLFYIDGVLDSPFQPVAKGVNTASGADVTIGSTPSGTYFTGMLDDVRIYDRVLSASEIAEYATARPLPPPSSGTIEYIAQDYAEVEGDAGSSTITVAVERKDGSSGAASVDYATADGTATLTDGDYAAASGTLNWADGESGYRSFAVTIYGDTTIEPDETISLTLSSVVGATPGAQTNATITIVNDDTAYTVTYDGNGSTGGTVPVDDNSYAVSNTVTVLGNTGNLVRSGYTFSGWNTAASGSGTVYVADQTFTMGASNVILYADWTAAPTYPLIVNNGSGDGDYAEGTVVPITATVTGEYHFVSWSGDTTYVADTNSASTTVTMPAASVTVSANVSINTYTVTFIEGTHGWRAGGGALVQTVEHGSAAVAPDMMADVGWIFDGWDAAFDSVTHDMTINALYRTNTAPSFTSDPILKPDATQGIAYSDTLAGLATDADGDPLTYAKVSGPAWLSVAGTGALTGTPGSSDAGANSWTVRVSDDNGGTNSAVLQISVNAVLPFADDFEALTPGDLNGQNGWTASDAVVQTNVAVGTQAARILADTGFVAHTFSGTETNVWTDFAYQPVLYDAVPAVDDPDATAVFLFNDSGHPVVYDGTNPVELASVTISTGAWVRVTVRSDYVAKAWNFYVDTVEVATGLGFYNAAVASYSGFRVEGAGSSTVPMDDVSVDRVAPFSGVVEYLLTVFSAHGTPSPTTGTTAYTSGSLVEVTISGSPITGGGTQYVATGWVGSGSVPASGTTTNTSFTINEDSAITWQWQTNYWVDLNVIGE